MKILFIGTDPDTVETVGSQLSQRCKVDPIIKTA